MWSASSPWPQASWNRMPPLPRRSPPAAAGRRRAGRQLGQGPGGGRAGPAPRPTPRRTARSRACGPPSRTRSACRCRPRATHETREPGPGLVVAGQQPLGVGDQDPPAAVAVAGLDLADGAARRPGRLVGPLQQLEVSALEPVRRRRPSPRRPGRPIRQRADVDRRVPPPPLRATAEAASAARSRPRSDRSAVWAKPVVSPVTTRMPAPRSGPTTAPRPGRRRAVADEFDRSSANTSANSPPCAQRLGQHPFQHGGIRSPRPPRSTARRPVADACCVAYRTGVAPRTGLSARIELEVTEADTAEAFRSGPVPVLATPRLVALCEEASCKAIEGQLPPTAPRWPSGSSSTIWCRWAWAGRSGPRPRWTGSRADAWSSPSRCPRVPAWWPPASSSGSIVDRDTFLANVR